MALAARAGLGDLVADVLALKAKGGVNAYLKVPALVAGTVTGAWLVLAAIAFNLTRAAGAIARASTPRPPPRLTAGS